jgi:hypothetical protein
MSSQDDDHALDRYVAGLDVAPDDLSAAVVSRALDRAVVVESLLRALEHGEAVVRLRAAERVAVMHDVGPRVIAALAVVVESDVDLDVRAAAAAALLAQLPAPGSSPAWRPLQQLGEVVASLRIRRTGLALRAPVPVQYELESDDRERAPQVAGRGLVDDDGLQVALDGLPAAFAGTYPTVIAAAGDEGEMVAVATAAAPVTADGSVTIHIPPEDDPAGTIAGVLGGGFELVVLGGA